MAVESRPLASLTFGERRRQDMGDLDALARSMEHFGLIHPIVIDDGGVLIAGGRRVAAAARLRWERIDCRLYGTLGDAERREIELEENLQRKDLTPYERSRTLVALAETAAEADRAGFRADSARNPASGRPEEPGSLRRISERVGIPEPTIRAAQQHVAAVERHALPPETPQAVALDYAAAVQAQPELAGAPLRPVVDLHRAQQQAQREQRDAEAEATRDVLHAAGALDDPTVRRRAMQRDFMTALGRARVVLDLRPEAYAEVLDAGDARVVRAFAARCREWCDRVERSLDAVAQPGLRLVGGE